jgi:DNA-binding NarL/FixJ family response regulator
MADPGRRTRILIVDDHALFRESIGRLLSREADFEVVSTCESVDQAFEVLGTRPVDVILLDFDLGRGHGADFLRHLKQERIKAQVLIVTAGIRPTDAAEVIREGVAGIFLKRDSAASLVQSIRDIEAGKVSFERGVFQQAVAEPQPSPSTPADPLTKRERQVISCLLEGLTNKEIADRLKVSEGSVKATFQQLFFKCGVRTRSQLVHIALERLKTQL